MRRPKKRTIRYAILAANIALLTVVVAFVVRSSGSRELSSTASVVTANTGELVDPLDQLSSADIAVNVARMTRLAEATSAANQADSVNALLAIAPPADQAVISKPQIITTGLKSIKDLVQYKTQKGDTVSSLAEKFGITSDSIRWSNNLTGNELTAGVLLWIPPVDGIVRVVRSGDTIASLAENFNSSVESITVFNDLELSGLRLGMRIVIPNGSKSSPGTGTGTVLFLGSGAYDYGWCTYYASAKGGVPGGWGNANTWHIYAALSGWTVSAVPKVGAVAQTTSGWAGHVGVVEAVKQEGGQYYIKYSDMNGLAGFNAVGYSDWVPAIGKYERFIYR